jgi:hypothetical protein
MSSADSLPDAEAELNYLVPMAERPRYHAVSAGPDAPPHTVFTDPTTPPDAFRESIELRTRVFHP